MKSVRKILRSIFTLPKRICSAIKASYFRSLKGEENLLVLLLGWGVFLYVGSFFIGVWTFQVPLLLRAHKVEIYFMKYTFQPLYIIVGSLGLIFVFLYPLVWSFCVARRSFKNGIEHRILACFIIAPFALFHKFASKVILAASIGLLKIHFTSEHLSMKILAATLVTLIFLLLLYIIVKTFSHLKK